jgi:hypothetical protein
MRKRLSKKLALNRESLRRLTPEALGEARGARPTIGGTCYEFTCADSCATCYASCVTCAASCTC